MRTKHIKFLFKAISLDIDKPRGYGSKIIVLTMELSKY